MGVQNACASQLFDGRLLSLKQKRLHNLIKPYYISGDCFKQMAQKSGYMEEFKVNFLNLVWNMLKLPGMSEFYYCKSREMTFPQILEATNPETRHTYVQIIGWFTSDSEWDISATPFRQWTFQRWTLYQCCRFQIFDLTHSVNPAALLLERFGCWYSWPRWPRKIVTDVHRKNIYLAYDYQYVSWSLPMSKLWHSARSNASSRSPGCNLSRPTVRTGIHTPGGNCRHGIGSMNIFTHWWQPMARKYDYTFKLAIKSNQNNYAKAQAIIAL